MSSPFETGKMVALKRGNSYKKYIDVTYIYDYSPLFLITKNSPNRTETTSPMA